MKLNSKKSKEMIINSMQYSPFPPAPLTVGGSVIERVVTYKLLGVYISDDLSWNVHIEHIVKKAKKRLYALRALKKSALTITLEEACINFIKRDCLSSPVLKPLIPCVSIDRPYCLRSGERVPMRLVPKTKRFADFCTIKFQDQL